MPESASASSRNIAEQERQVVNPAQFLLRCSLLLGLVVGGLLVSLLMYLDWGKRLPRERIGRRWSRMLVRTLNLEITVRGEMPTGAALVVANHVSWLDIPALLSQFETRFVSKSEVQRWPIAGWLADAAGTFYIRRGSGAARPLLNRLSPHLAGGGRVCIFPEGTTTDGTEVLGFHARMFCAAIESGQKVVPIALRYSPVENGEHIAPFIGDDDLFSHLMRVLRTPRLSAEITVCKSIAPDGLSRADLAKSSRKAVCTALRIEAA